MDYVYALAEWFHKFFVPYFRTIQDFCIGQISSVYFHILVLEYNEKQGVLLNLSSDDECVNCGDI